MKLLLLTQYNKLKIEEFTGELEGILWRFKHADHEVEVICTFEENKSRMIGLSSRNHPGSFSIEFNLGDGVLRRILDREFNLEESLELITKYIIDAYSPNIDYDCDSREEGFKMSEEDLDKIFSKLERPWWKFW